MSNRTVTTLPGPAPLQIVELQGLLFSGTISGADSGTGVLHSKPEKQFKTAFENLARLLDTASSHTDELGLVTVGVPDAQYVAYLNEPWLRTFPDMRHRPACKVNQYPLPYGALVHLQVTGVRGRRPTSLEIPGLAHGQPIPSGARIGNLAFSSLVPTADPSTGNVVADPESQIRQAFQNAKALLRETSATWDDVIHVYAFLADRPNQQPVLDRVWPELFPIQGFCPARKAVQYDALKGGDAIAQLQLVAHVGQGERRRLLLPDVPVHDTGTMGAAIGRLVWSCGLSGNPHGNMGTLAEQSEWVARHARTFIELAGGTTDNIGQVTIMLKQYEDAPTVMKYWRQLFPDPADEPAHHIVGFGLNPQNTERVQYHVVAVV
jgi:2-iminobutanoate/2-iminopropanoate deaminase